VNLPKPPATPPVRIIREGDTSPPPKLSPNRVIKEDGTHKGFWSKIPKDPGERGWGLACLIFGFHIGVVVTLIGIGVALSL